MVDRAKVRASARRFGREARRLREGSKEAPSRIWVGDIPPFDLKAIVEDAGGELDASERLVALDEFARGYLDENDALMAAAKKRRR